MPDNGAPIGSARIDLHVNKDAIKPEMEAAKAQVVASVKETEVAARAAGGAGPGAGSAGGSAGGSSPVVGEQAAVGEAIGENIHKLTQFHRLLGHLAIPAILLAEAKKIGEEIGNASIAAERFAATLGEIEAGFQKITSEMGGTKSALEKQLEEVDKAAKEARGKIRESIAKEAEETHSDPVSFLWKWAVTGKNPRDALKEAQQEAADSDVAIAERSAKTRARLLAEAEKKEDDENTKAYWDEWGKRRKAEFDKTLAEEDAERQRKIKIRQENFDAREEFEERMEKRAIDNAKRVKAIYDQIIDAANKFLGSSDLVSSINNLGDILRVMSTNRRDR